MDQYSFSAVLSINENRSRILAFIISMVRDFDIAEELFQETVIEILKSEDQFDPSRQFIPWACGIAKNVVRQYWKRQQKLPTSGINDIIADLAMISVEGENDQWSKDRKALRTCLNKLPERMQNLLMLRYGQNIKGPSLAKAASFRPNSIRTTLARLRTKLKQCIHVHTAQQ